MEKKAGEKSRKKEVGEKSSKKYQIQQNKYKKNIIPPVISLLAGDVIIILYSCILSLLHWKHKRNGIYMHVSSNPHYPISVCAYIHVCAYVHPYWGHQKVMWIW